MRIFGAHFECNDFFNPSLLDDERWMKKGILVQYSPSPVQPSLREKEKLIEKDLWEGISYKAGYGVCQEMKGKRKND
ncbi:MAG: hypothetical protein ACI4GW_05405 [Lachnospiraceae bacterium]